MFVIKQSITGDASKLDTRVNLVHEEKIITNAVDNFWHIISPPASVSLQKNAKNCEFGAGWHI